MGHVETYATLVTTGAISLTYLLINKRILISQREKGADIKDYGEVALYDKQGRELMDDLLSMFLESIGKSYTLIRKFMQKKY